MFNLAKKNTAMAIFNFNKCCIWIYFVNTVVARGNNLTLTSVVFEYGLIVCVKLDLKNLTLTSVVFEF